jgi:hypothetical protein
LAIVLPRRRLGAFFRPLLCVVVPVLIQVLQVVEALVGVDVHGAELKQRKGAVALPHPLRDIKDRTL